MALVLDFLGDYKGYFQKASWEVFCNPTPDGPDSMQYVGKVENEIEIDSGIENIEWFTNTSGVQVLYVLTQTKVDPKVNFSWMQVADPNVLGFTWALDMDDTDPNYFYSHFGSNPDDYAYKYWIFASQSLSGLVAEFHVLQGVLSANGTWTSGSPGALSNVPATVRMTQDTTVTNTKRDLGYIRIQKRSFS